MSVGERERVAVRESRAAQRERRGGDEWTSGCRAAERNCASAPASPEVGARIAQFCARRTVDGLALGQVLVVRAGQYAGAVAAEEALQVAVVDVAKEHRFVCVEVWGNAKLAGREVAVLEGTRRRGRDGEARRHTFCVSREEDPDFALRSRDRASPGCVGVRRLRLRDCAQSDSAAPQPCASSPSAIR